MCLNRLRKTTPQVSGKTITGKGRQEMFDLQMRGDVELHDNGTRGGVAFKGEALKECGIEPLYEHEIVIRRAV